MSVSERSALAPGRVIRGTYIVEEVLGAGAFSTVYRVRHRFLGNQAMKVFHVGEGLPAADEVVSEARILCGLVNPCVVRVFEANTIEDEPPLQPYMTMELVTGGTLEAFLKRKVRLDPLSALKTARDICTGLAAAHQAIPPIVHRDVKPQNVLVWSVSPHGTPRVKVGDFGLARHVHPDSRMARAAGTLHYLAPEAIWGVHSPASDVYATGVVLYRMLTGTFPFPLPEGLESTSEERRRAFLLDRRRAPPPPSRFRMGLPAQIDGPVLRALAPDPTERYPSAVAFGSQLDQLIGEFS